MSAQQARVITLVILVGTAVALTTGCSTNSPTNASPLKPTIGSGVDLTKYQVATVVAFDVTSTKVKDPAVGVRFAKEIAWKLQYGFGALFKEVRQGQPTGRANELIVTGGISKYVRGLQNVGGWSFEGNLTLKDGADGHVLFSAPFQHGQIMTFTVFDNSSAEGLEAKAASEAANTIARAKGWH